MSTTRQLKDVIIRTRLAGGAVGRAWIVVTSCVMIAKQRIAPGLAIPLWLRPRRVFWVRDRAQLWNVDEVWLRGEYEQFAGDPEVILDLGANVGTTATWFAARYPRARIVAVEPDPPNIELLERNTRRFTQIQVLAAAVSAGSTPVGIVRDKFSWGTRVVEGGTTPSLTLRYLLRAYPGRTFVKMDIEGSEWAVLRALTPADIPEEIFGELHDADDAPLDWHAELDARALALGMVPLPCQEQYFHWRKA